MSAKFPRGGGAGPFLAQSLSIAPLYNYPLTPKYFTESASYISSNFIVVFCLCRKSSFNIVLHV